MNTKLQSLLILTATALLVSCESKPTHDPAVMAVADSVGEGILGDAGRELVLLLDDRPNNKKSFDKKPEDMQTSIKEQEDLKEKWLEEFNTFVKEKLVGKEVLTELAEDVPLKVVKPFTVVSASFTSALVFEAVMELTDDRPPIVTRHYYPEDSFMPTIIPVGADGENVINEPQVAGAPDLKDRRQDLKKGQQIKVTYHQRFDTSSDLDGKFMRSLRAKKLMVLWDKPTPESAFELSDGKLGPLSLGQSIDQLPKSINRLYDRFEYTTQDVENDMEGSWTEEWVHFYKGDKEIIKSFAEGRRLKSFVVMEGAEFVHTTSDFHVGYPARKLFEIFRNNNIRWETYFEGTAFATSGHYTFHINSDDLVGADMPKKASDIKPDAKISMIVLQ